jgi:hypothetical protein
VHVAAYCIPDVISPVEMDCFILGICPVEMPGRFFRRRTGFLLGLGYLAAPGTGVVILPLQIQKKKFLYKFIEKSK